MRTITIESATEALKPQTVTAATEYVVKLGGDARTFSLEAGERVQVGFAEQDALRPGALVVKVNEQGQAIGSGVWFPARCLDEAGLVAFVLGEEW